MATVALRNSALSALGRRGLGGARAFSSEKTSYGNLSDEDRIFTNLTVGTTRF